MTDGVLSGRVVRIGDDVDTDVMLPGAYLNITDPQELGTHLLETYSDPEVGRRIDARRHPRGRDATAAWDRRASTRRWP